MVHCLTHETLHRNDRLISACCVLGNILPVADFALPGCQCFGRVFCRHSALSDGSSQSPHSDTAGLGQQLPTGSTKTDGRGRHLWVSDICLREMYVCYSCRIALAQLISPVATHFFVTWFVCCLSCSCTVLKAFHSFQMPLCAYACGIQ